MCDGEGAGEQETLRREGEETRDTGSDQIRQDPTVNGGKAGDNRVLTAGEEWFSRRSGVQKAPVI